MYQLPHHVWLGPVLKVGVEPWFLTHGKSVVWPKPVYTPLVQEIGRISKLSNGGEQLAVKQIVSL